MAKGYLVVCYREIRDPEKLKTYAELAPKAMLPRGANILVRDGRVAAFEDGLAERTVVVEFPASRRPSRHWAMVRYATSGSSKASTERETAIAVPKVSLLDTRLGA